MIFQKTIRFAASPHPPVNGYSASTLYNNALEFFVALTTLQLTVWLVAAATHWAMGERLQLFDGILASLVAAIACATFGRSQFGPSWRTSAILGIGALTIAWALAFLFAAAFDDLSVDGQAYHALAVNELLRGWNPFRTDLGPNEPPWLWANHYPKASWVWAAGIYQMFGKFYEAKATNFVLFFASGAAVASAASLVLGAPLRTSLIAGALAAANPVVIVQLTTGYVDGQVGSLLTIMGAGSLTWIVRRSPLSLLTACSAAVCLTNVKFTGAVSAVFIALVVLVISLASKRLAGALPLMACVFALSGPGFSPYMKNILDGRHPLHPLLGSRSVDIISSMQPVAFDGHSSIEKLVLSLASETANSCRACDAPQGHLKLPFTIHLPTERDGAAIPDARTGGFGPLFSAAMALSGILFAFAVRNGKMPRTIGLLMAVLIGLVLINPEAWWARYAPQLWLIPLTVWLIPSAVLSQIGRMAHAALLIVLIADTAFMAKVAIGSSFANTKMARAQLASVADGVVYLRRRDSHVPFRSEFEFESVGAGARQRFHDGNLRYSLAPVSWEHCQTIQPVLYSEVELCVEDRR